MITKRPHDNGRGVIVTICNYNTYQPTEPQESRDRAATEPDESPHRVSSDTRIEELKNLRREESKKDISLPQPVEVPTKPKKEKVIVPIDPENLQLGREWYDFAVRRKPYMATDDRYSPEKFAEGIEELRAKKDIHADGVRRILKWIENDDFWCDNALSPNNLLTSRKGGLRKIDTILNKMQPPRDKQKEACAKYAKEGQPMFDPFQEGLK